MTSNARKLRTLCLAPALLVSAHLRAQTIHLEAENARLEGPSLHAVRPDPGGTPPRRTNFSGTGYVTGFDKPQDRLVFSFKVKTPGIYLLKIAYACDNGKGFDLEVGGRKISGHFPATAGNGFATLTAARVELGAGPNDLAIDYGWGFFDIDYVELRMAPAVTAPARPLARPSDPDASPEAAALLARLDDRYGKATALGVYTDADAQYVQDTTGLRPAIMGGDLIDYATTPLAHGTDPHETERLMKDANDGCTLTLSWHWRPPLGVIDKMLPDGYNARWYMSFYARATTFDFTVAMREASSPERAALVKDIDLIAVQLKRLQEAGIPVLWRPLHEAQGRWFWWGAKGPEPFVWLWRFLHDRLVKVDGVHNLLWVFTSGDDPAWYPGDDFVDIVGIDAYPKDLHDPETQLWDQLQQLFVGRKPLAISEFGGVPDIPAMQRFGEFWAYAVSWQDKLGPKENSVDELKRIYHSDGTDKLPAKP